MNHRIPVEMATSDDGIWDCLSPEGVRFVVACDPHPPADLADLPCNGGIRIKPFSSDAECRREAQALARRMTEKQALFNVGLSGSKITVRADPETVDKAALMAAIGQVLCDLEGRVYTGSDLNVTGADMRLLGELCPYVLAGLGTSIDPSVATAHGVVGALCAALGNAALSSTSVLVHGIGKVGSVCASELLRRGCSVRTFDREARRAEIPGAINVSHIDRWWREPVDVVVLCSDSFAVDPQRAKELQCRLVVGSANLPFAEHDRVCRVLRERRILFLPDPLTSPGATICDSIELYCPEVFQQAVAADVYRFVHTLVESATARVLARSKSRDPHAIDPVALEEETRRALSRRRCGDRFEAWVASSREGATEPELLDVDALLEALRERGDRELPRRVRYCAGYDAADRGQVKNGRLFFAAAVLHLRPEVRAEKVRATLEQAGYQAFGDIEVPDGWGTVYASTYFEFQEAS